MFEKHHYLHKRLEGYLAKVSKQANTSNHARGTLTLIAHACSWLAELHQAHAKRPFSTKYSTSAKYQVTITVNMSHFT